MIAAQVHGVEALPRHDGGHSGGMRPRHSSSWSGNVTETVLVLVTVSYSPSTTVTLGARDATSDGYSDERE
jgi:hypothetical protein